MANSQRIVCPVCVRLFRAWYQADVTQVMCPWCGMEVNLKSRTARESCHPRRFNLLTNSLAAALQLRHLTRHWRAKSASPTE
jgi:hypothetical protein